VGLASSIRGPLEVHDHEFKRREINELLLLSYHIQWPRSKDRIMEHWISPELECYQEKTNKRCKGGKGLHTGVSRLAGGFKLD
jgi:hypothetical protein